MRVTSQDKEEFTSYLRQLTDRQVVSAYEKERDARRRVYARLALEEMERRGLSA